MKIRRACHPSRALSIASSPPPARPREALSRRTHARSRTRAATLACLLAVVALACGGDESLDQLRALQAKGDFTATVEPLRTLLGELPEKLRFSSASCLDWSKAAGSEDRPKIVIAGIETHVCVQQTVLDLLAAGFSVYVVADAVASRSHLDRDIAFQRMRDSGAIVTTVEAVLFEWCEAAGTPEFKEISRLVKERGPATVSP